MRAIHQLVAGFSRGDAISNEAIVLREIFRSWGADSEVFSEQRRILPELRRDARDIQHAKAAVETNDIALLHLSIGSIVNDVFSELSCHKAILYHNITPSEYFRGIQEEIARNLAHGRQQARRLATAGHVNLADSTYNAKEFQEMGCPTVAVFPLILDLAKLRQGFDRSQVKELDDGKTNVLFVGRCAPNKRIEDIMYAFHFFQRYVEPNSRLIIAGSFSGLESYYAYLLTVQRDLKIRDVVFTGSVRQEVLNACYRSADLFLCMSEHEGFCIPIIESMVMDVPVLAYSAAAVPDTMDGAGVLFGDKKFDLIAEMMGELISHEALRESVLQTQRDRVARYESRDLRAELRQHLAPLVGV